MSSPWPIGSDYLKFRLERHRLNRQRPKWLEAFRRACCPDAQESDFLPADEARALQTTFYGKLRTAKSIWTARYDTYPVIPSHLVQAIGQSFDNERAVLLETPVGAVEAPIRALFTNVEAVWKLSQRDFAVVTRDIRNGLLLETEMWQGPGPRHDDRYFEIRAWGNFVPRVTT
jgi:hypothetical protein